MKRPAPARIRPPRRRRQEPGAAKRPAPVKGTDRELVFRTLSGKEFRIAIPAELKDAALRWTYALRNRQRWVEHDPSREAQARQAHDDLLRFGLTEEALADLAGGEVVQVSVPYRTEDEGWETRIFPWEYVIAGATRELRAKRGVQSVLIVRHLEVQRPLRQRSAPRRLAVVESAPGGLRAQYSFESESRMVKEEIGLKGEEPIVDPSRELLRTRISREKPDVIHVTGFDTHQAADLLGLPEDPHRPDGLLLDEDGPTAVEAPDVAKLLNSASNHPQLVAFNTYNSGARLAPLAVAEGAESAIGFQDDIDDRFAEAFFALFYRTWRATGWDTLEAFRKAWAALRDQPRRTRGTGVVLWSARPLVGAKGATARRLTARGRRLPPPVRATEPLPPRVEVDPLPELNYALLHNDRGLFKTFVLRRASVHDVEGVQVDVELHVSGESFPFRATVALTGGQPSLDLDKIVRVPLTSALARAARESVHTSLYVGVKWANAEIRSQTFRVTLLPVDQWRDTKTDRIWLPSFALPRDAAVLRVVDAAQRYLMTLVDDSAAGFDGYQSLDDTSEDPAEGVDLQVQALWAALIQDFGLSYINPPPTYAQTDQRLRFPSEVLSGRRGTCIDLALLLASCLEYVDIYPVVFLLEGHAFPGYWRTDRYHEAFSLARSSLGANAGTTAAELAQGTAGERDPPWYFGRPEHYDEILGLVRRQQIVPLETVSLTRRGSFWEAVDEGLTNLRSRREFQAMIDLTLARRNGVTPLPIRSELA